MFNYKLPNGEGNLLYLVTDKKIDILGYSGPIRTLIIPEKIDNLPVKNVLARSFEYAPFLEKVVFPKNFDWIDRYAFSKCERLVNVILPEKISYISDFAFSDCKSLSNIIFPNAIGDYSIHAFDNTPFQRAALLENNALYAGKHLIYVSRYFSGHYNVKNGTEVVGSYAFANCSNIESITFPKSLKELRSDSFLGCTSLKSVKIRSNLKFSDIGDDVFRSCSSNFTVYCYPETEIFKYLNDDKNRYKAGLPNVKPLQSDMMKEIFQNDMMSQSYLGTNYDDEIIL